MHYALYFANVVSPLRFSYKNTIFCHTAVIKKNSTHFKLVSPVQSFKLKFPLRKIKIKSIAKRNFYLTSYWKVISTERFYRLELLSIDVVNKTYVLVHLLQRMYPSLTSPKLN